MMSISIDILDLAAFVVYIVSLFVLMAINIRQRRKFSTLSSEHLQLLLDKGALLEKIETLNLEYSKEANDGFVKFLSQSRDWAFEYIEDAQDSIRNYQTALEGSDPVVAMEARQRMFDLLPGSLENEAKA
jgi:hypothetical protein